MEKKKKKKKKKTKKKTSPLNWFSQLVDCVCVLFFWVEALFERKKKGGD